MAQNIVIYQDEGAGEFGVKCLAEFFKGDEVWFCTAESVIDGRILQMADIFVMPGGADLPYCKKLNGAGNENIRAFVEDGGTYLGVCAGAYYACSSLEYHKGRPDEISGKRELALIDAVAYGSLSELAPHYDLTLQSAAIANMIGEDGTAAQAFYHGGCAFRLKDPETEIIARYADLPGTPPAIIAKDVGEGRVILSGVHFEIYPDKLGLHPRKEDEKAALEKLIAVYKNHYGAMKSIVGSARWRG